MAAVNGHIVWQGKKPGLDAFEQSPAVGVAEVRAADGAGKQSVAGEQGIADPKRDPARAVARRVEDHELE
jgi:hypothetical protein